ncbi:HlyD family secretion protein [Rhodobacteraceae bacterium DSL-40]|uniref:HlyD family secretion protein n=1 Tax=Amaricoccus sp. B4 TaxID=3368557 RepID=UPI000DAF472C
MPRDHVTGEGLDGRTDAETALRNDASPGAGRTEAAGGPPDSSEAPASRGRRKRTVLAVIGLVALAGIAWFGYDYWTVGRFEVSTDDAYVEADFAILSPKVTAYVASVPAKANSAVKAGDPLVVLDDGDYRNALESAQADLASQKASIDRIGLQLGAADAAITQAKAKLDAARADAVQTAADLARYERLVKTDVATEQRVESARASDASARAAVTEAEAGIATAEADREVVIAQKAEAEAALPKLDANVEQAQRNLDATVLRAPVDGIVGNLSVAQGDFVTPGKRLLAVVPMGQIYVEANFKETQIAELAPGTKVDLSVDAFPDRHVEGQVEGISPASGAVFSLLPPENATGNFTKIVQRVPVRVNVPADIAAEGWLRPGLSVTVTADTRTTPEAAQH